MQTVTRSASAASAPPAFGYASTARDDGRETTNVETVRRYLAAIEAGVTGQTLAAFFAPEVEQIEFPNRLVPTGATRDLPALLAGALRGQQVLRAQRYEVQHVYADGDTVVLEAAWFGTLASGIGALPAGGEMRAHFAVVVELRDGRIVRQRNYDCFDAF